mmetsp:Transcript_8615/g.14567  ORF Transcript_8615/g.14567 Transcript_8615/m.14567 type:complete len:93 (-) Transcript_8615:1007-1285(-)
MDPNNPENFKFFPINSYTSVVTPELVIVGTEDKQEFTKNFLENKELRAEFKLIGTHSGAFHCDEVLATSLLLRTNQFRKSVVVRSRDQDLLD